MYPLKLASKKLPTICLLALLCFCIPFLVESVCNGFSMPNTLSAPSLQILRYSMFVLLGVLPFFVFYRQKVEIYMDEQGILLPTYGLITWECIQWYRFEIFSSSSGIRGLTLHYGRGKAVLLASDNESLMLVEEAIKKHLQTYNPLAKDFRELKSSRIKAYWLISFFTVLHLTISWMMGFETKYILLFTPALFITIGAILLDFIKRPAQ